MRSAIASLFLLGLWGAVAAASEPRSPAEVPPAEDSRYPIESLPAASSWYLSPFQLRSIVSKTGVRIDAISALFTLDGRNAVETVTFVSAQIRVHEWFAVQAKWGFDNLSTPRPNESRWGVTNPTVGGLFSAPIAEGLRLAGSLVLGVPFATGGGNGGDPRDLVLQKKGGLARSAMDNLSFAVNDVGLRMGLSVAYQVRPWTFQIDTSLIPTVRVKGAEVQRDASKVNSTHGVFIGVFLIPELSLGAELRYQRYLTIPAAVADDPSARQNLTAAIGVRSHARLSSKVWIRPAIVYSQGLVGPVEQQSFRMLQVDIPISF